VQQYLLLFGFIEALDKYQHHQNQNFAKPKKSSIFVLCFHKQCLFIKS
jgi:hypothetical protein